MSYLEIFLACMMASAIGGLHQVTTGREMFRTRGQPKLPPLTGSALIWHRVILAIVGSMAAFSIGSLLLFVGAFRGWWALPPFL